MLKDNLISSRALEGAYLPYLYCKVYSHFLTNSTSLELVCTMFSSESMAPIAHPVNGTVKLRNLAQYSLLGSVDIRKKECTINEEITDTMLRLDDHRILRLHAHEVRF
jgi:hypothetical protein